MEETWESNGVGNYEILSIRGTVDFRDVMEIVGEW